MPRDTTPLDDVQLAAVQAFMDNGISIIQGGPGTGKTSIIQEMVRRAGGDDEVLVVTPTGVTAGNLIVKDVCAQTISRVLYDDALMTKFHSKALIMDEGSMVSVKSANLLFAAVRAKRVVILGDCRQLPCIDGFPLLNTLRELQLTKTTLVTNYRILDPNCGLARTLNALGTGAPPVEDHTLRIVRCGSDAEAILKAVEVFTDNPDAQMLALTRATKDRLNALTTKTESKRVVCIANLYKGRTMVVSNGTLGVMTEDGDVVYQNGFLDKKRNGAASKATKLGTAGAFTDEDGQVRVGKYASEFEDARCMTVHKAQGSEFSELGIAVLTTFRGIPPLELLYTLLSRFRIGLTVFGTAELVDAVFKGKFDEDNVDWKLVDVMERGTRGAERMAQMMQRAKVDVRAMYTEPEPAPQAPRAAPKAAAPKAAAPKAKRTKLDK